MKIAQLNPLYVEVFVPVSHYREITRDMEVEVRPEEPIGGVYQAKVIVVDSVFDAASRTFGVRLELDNSSYELPGGLRCTVTFNGVTATEE
jgi:multidrug efflux pump subunit AcrA (membrane-fusion protein)